MTDAPAHMKWFYRGTLVAITATMTYVAVQPQYNFAHWIPHSMLRDLGVPYEALLYFESHADKLLHPLIAFMLTMLICKAEISNISLPPVRPLFLVLLTMLVAELIQLQIGRGFEMADLALGLAGALLAYLVVLRQQHKPK